MNSKLRKIKVVAGVILYQQKILITKRPLDVHMGGNWEFPGGKVENNESDREALRRELKEELSIEATVNQFLLETRYRYESFEVNLFFYECFVSSYKAHDNFVLEHKWVLPSDIKDYTFPPANNEIKSLILKKY